MIILYPNYFDQATCYNFISELCYKETKGVDAYFKDYEPTENYNITKKPCYDHTLVKQIADELNYDVSSASFVTYPTNSFNGLHCDNSVIDSGCVKQIREWKRTCILFLNDDFEGGDLVYPHQGVNIKPTIGSMCEAPAGYPFYHEVTKITSGIRYSLVIRINN